MISVEEVFSACGLTASQVQIDYANRVSSAIACAIQNTGGEALIEADTGVGKTIGYLIPAAIKVVEYNGRAIVSTYTKSLQRQAMSDAEKVIEGIRLASGRELRVARLIGRSNFFDIDKVRSIIKSLENDNAPEESLKEWQDLLDWLEEDGSSCEIQDYLDEAEHLPGNVHASLVCLDSSSSKEAAKQYLDHVADAKGADILVTNHSLLCLASLRGLRILHDDEDDRPIVAVILDEADRLPDVARNMMTDQAPLVSAARIVKHLSSFMSEHLTEALEKSVAGMLEAAEAIYRKRPSEAILIEDIERLMPEDFRALRESAIDFVGALDQADQELSSIRSDHHVTEVVDDLNRYKKVLQAALLNENEYPVTGVLQFSPSRKFPSISLARLYPARIVRTLIDYLHEGAVGDDGEFRRQPFGTGLVLTSATLRGSGTADDPFWEMKVQFGIHDRTNACGHLHASFSPKKFGKIEKIVLADPSVSKPFIGIDEEDDVAKVSEEWVSYTASMIARASKEGGYVLALTGSYRVAAMLSIALRELDAELHIVQKQRAEHVGAAIARLLQQPAGVFITPAGWEGLNAPSFGFSWSHVVICQLPIARTDSAYKAALADFLVRRGKSKADADAIVYGEVMSAAFRKMRQGIGRGIRSANDSIMLWIADPRVPPFGSVTESDEPYPQPANRTMPQFARAVPKRFAETPTAILLNDGTLVE